ncbi:MAG: tRNA (N6-isopentenyl adenosine(37)-C2)-methylthiotransferase MiaB [Planctomycetes bacterium]|nr:tRNA (N6-isopentenyl adenosine(37)-C2)-methylthiotransferase MiaB [Planctomycetota bacterium]
MRRLYLFTQGCQMNFLDSEIVLSQLLREGYTLVESPGEADVALFNSCSVRHDVENKVYSRLGALSAARAERPGLVIGVLGCMAQKERADLFHRMPHVDFVCGTSELARVPELLRDVQRGRRHQVATDLLASLAVERDPAVRPDPYRAFVSVMRGCNLSCSYCVVPRTRGPEVSRPPAAIVEEVRRLVDDGVREVTLLGQTVNSYGVHGEAGARFADLLARVDAVAGLERLRFVTSHPNFVTAEMIAAMRDLPSVCEYLHFPFQAGANRVLEAMKRRYTIEEYLDLVARVREGVPGLALATDVIVGFPGETEEEFERTAAVMEAVRFQTTFIFKYSPRERTAAFRLRDDVALAEKKRRNNALLDIQERINAEINREAVGTTEEVLVEGPSKTTPARWTGRTRTNRIVVFDPRPDLAGRLATVRIVSATPLTLFGEIVADSRPALAPMAATSTPTAAAPLRRSPSRDAPAVTEISSWT